ncbi:hypothetical protein [Arthrobacter sp. BF1]|uniref:hypothetical protein n=1 Tax=Arthrobacter sp. BF1 TaxID=2821145 RepID=UPI001C4E686B|nr:hypothetical protein [Arthrobacter sp. BF1]
MRITSAAYLRTALKRHCTEDQIERAIASSPAAAGIPLKVIIEVANTSVAYETSKVTGFSTLAGIPRGLAMIGTVPANLAQYMWHMLRIAQKLAYIYSWPDLFADDGDDVDEATETMLILSSVLCSGYSWPSEAWQELRGCSPRAWPKSYRSKHSPRGLSTRS